MNINYDSPFDFKPIPTITPVSDYWQNGTWKFNMSKITAGTAYAPSFVDIILHGVTALTLVNAKADSLEYLKLFGGCEQRNLPSGYTQVEYIRSSGTQYIDTGIMLPSTFHIKMKIKFSSFSPQFGLLCGARNKSEQQGRLGFTLIRQNDKLGYDVDGITDSRAITPGLNLNTWYTVEFVVDSTGSKFFLDGTLIRAINQKPTMMNYPLYIFDANTANATTDFMGAFDLCDFQISGLANYIPAKNSSNVLGMYDTVSGNFLTNAGTGTFTAGADVTAPTPTQPINIVSNNGTIKVNTNLYWTEYDGKQLSQLDGVTLSPNTSVNVSGMVDCRTIKSFMITTANPAGSYRLFKYNSGKTFIDSSMTGNIGDVVTLDSTAGFFRIQYNFSRGNVGTRNVLIYDSAYSLNEIYTDGTVETVQITGKNLFTGQEDITQGYYLNDNGVAASAAGLAYTNGYTVVNGGTYTFSGYGYASEPRGNFSAVCYDENKNVLGRVGRMEFRYNYSTFTTLPNTKYLRFNIPANTTSTSPLQLELGSTATTYEPYYNGGSATAEDLFKIGDYKDEQEVLTGGVTRNVGVKVLDGTEDWSLTGTSFRFDGNINFTQPNTCLCTHFKGWLSSDSITDMPDLSIKAGHPTYTYRVYARYDRFTTVEQLKSWLAQQYAQGTPVIIVYSLATPTTETVTPQPMNIQAGTNNVTITQASMDDLELEVKYKAGVTVTIEEIENAQLDDNVEVVIS